MGKKGNFLHCWWECKSVQPLWRTVWRLLKILKSELPHDTVIPLLACVWRKTIIWKYTCTPVFIVALFINKIARTWKHPKCPLTKE